MLEGADVYSNIMYVNDDLPRLSALARRMMEIDRYRCPCPRVTGRAINGLAPCHRPVDTTG